MRGRPKIYFYRKPVRDAAIRAGLRTDTAIAEQAPRLTQQTVSRFFKTGSCSEKTMDELCKLLALDKEKLRDNSRHLRQAGLFE